MMWKANKNKQRRRVLWIPLILGIILVISVIYTVVFAKQANLFKEGVAYLHKNMYSEAIVKFDAALEIRKSVGQREIEILKYRAEAESMLHDLTASTHTYGILKEHHGLTDELECIYAMQLLQLGETDKAKELLEDKKGKTGVLYIEALLLLADTYMAKQEYENALVYLSMASEKSPAQELAQSIRQKEIACYEYLGNYETALDKANAYIAEYGEEASIRHEILFLESRLQ